MIQAEPITKTTWRIRGCGCDCYLVDGEVPALIDCGCGEVKIRQFCEALIQKPVRTVICTHAHIDHTGQCGLFDQVYMTERTATSSRNAMDENPTKLHLEYTPVFVQDHEILKLGQRCLEILRCDCHAPGNIMILDHTERILYAGDELDADQVLLLPGFAEKAGQFHSAPAATVSDYRRLLIQLDLRREEFDWICTGHNGSPLKPEVLTIMIELCDRILAGEEGCLDCSSATYSARDRHFPYPQAHYRRASWKGFSLVYCADSLTDRAQNSSVIPATPLHAMCEHNAAMAQAVLQKNMKSSQ